MDRGQGGVRHLAIEPGPWLSILEGEGVEHLEGKLAVLEQLDNNPPVLAQLADKGVD